MANARQVAALLNSKHQVKLQGRATAGRVELELLRSSRRECKSDQRLDVSAAGCRELMRLLQSLADEADRLQYLETKRAKPDELAAVVEQLARAGVQ